ncbi:MAG: hypothetical protein JNM96_07755 [Bacteroidia bacterium]|nr:hypothetical protein [Bacteroidia bacterium]
MIDWKTIWKAFLDLILISFFTMLATIITLISMLVNSDEPINWESLYNNGNFFLYAISLFSSSLIYFLHKKDRQFGKYFLMILIIICAITYSQFINNNTSNTYYTKYGSLVFLIISSFAFLVAQYHQHLSLIDLNQADQNNQNAVAQGVNF